MEWILSLQQRALPYAQRSNEWLEHKAKIISSSEVAAALQSNPYETRISLLHRKCSPASSIEVQTTESMLWGEKYEPIAKEIFQALNGLQVFDVGLVVHANHTWLGASPDGLLMNRRLIEIKCPKHRKIIKDKIPIYYWIQMQIQMEVCDVSMCHFFQCKFEESDTPFTADFAGKVGNKYYRLVQHDDTLVVRDKQWFERIFPELEKFWNDVQHYRIHGIGKLVADAGKTLLYFDTHTGQMVPEQSNSVRSINRMLGLPNIQERENNLEEPIANDPNDPATFSKWISPSDIQNFLHDDPLIDWLEMFAKGNIHNRLPLIPVSIDDIQSFAFAKGAQFENAVVQALKRMFPTNVITIGQDELARSKEAFENTKKAIQDGYGIIHHAVLHDNENQTFGVADLLIQGNFLKQLVPSAQLQATDKYYVIDIKYRGLELCANGIHMRNTPIVVAHKGQVAMYNQMLAKIQGFKPRYAYILGRKWEYESRGEKYRGFNWFDRLGHVDFEAQDKFIEQRIEDAKNWINRLRTVGHEWQLFPPSVPELYPNMKSDCDSRWHRWKLQYAKELSEITSVWYCNVAARKSAHLANVYSYKDPRCTAAVLNIGGAKIGPTLDDILNVNRMPIGTVMPEKITNEQRIQRHKVEIFLDFETIQDEADLLIVTNSTTISEQYLVMIGIGYIVDGNPSTYTYKNFTAARMDLENERSLFILMHTYIGQILYANNAFDDFVIYHWANAEVVVYDRLFEQYGECVSSILNYFTFQWFDLCDWFRKNRIVVSGALDFKLKSISAALHLGGHIDSSYSGSQITDGYTAMITMLLEEKRCVESNIPLDESTRMQEVIKYNALDCKVLHEILEFLYEHFQPKRKLDTDKKNTHNRKSAITFDDDANSATVACDVDPAPRKKRLIKG